MMDHKHRFWILKIIIFLADIGYLVKRLNWVKLNPESLENASNFEGWGLNLVAYKKSVFFQKKLFYRIAVPKDFEKFIGKLLW